MLFNAAAGVPSNEAIVEIGSHHGRSTVILAAAKGADVELVAVDPYEDARWGGGQDALTVFQNNLRSVGVEHGVRLVRSYGAQAGHEWTGQPAGLLFVDGAHDYRSVVADLTAWLPHLAPTAGVLMHDAYSSPGVTAAAFRQMFGSKHFRYSGSSRSLALFVRAESQGSVRRLVSSARMVGRLPWLARNLAIKIAMRRGWAHIPRLLGHSDPVCPY